MRRSRECWNQSRVHSGVVDGLDSGSRCRLAGMTHLGATSWSWPKSKIAIPMQPSRRLLIRPSTFFILFVSLCSSACGVIQALAQDPDSKAPEKVTFSFSKARQAEQHRDFAEAARFVRRDSQDRPRHCRSVDEHGPCLHELSKHREAAKPLRRQPRSNHACSCPTCFWASNISS
jgi:hypothetical protein